MAVPTSTATRFAHALGLSPSTRPINVFALSSSAFFSISYLVFVNTIQPFLLTTSLDPPVPSDILGEYTGNLILADELLSLAMVFVWGAVADGLTVRFVACVGHILVAIGLGFYSRANSVYPAVLLSRLLFATGASALLTSLGAALAVMTAVPASSMQPLTAVLPKPTRPLRPRPPQIAITRASTATIPSSTLADRTSFVTPGMVRTEAPGEMDETEGSEAVVNPKHAARFAALLGFSSGSGALLGVFGFFRLPAVFTSFSAGAAIRVTFLVVALVALLEGLFLVYGLAQRFTGNSELSEEPALSVQEDMAVKTRAQSLIVTAFIPLYINHYFTSQGCPPPCHRSVVLSASLTGTIQLISLLLSPVIGYLVPRLSSPLSLAFSSLLGCISFAVFAFLPNGDPTSARVWVAGFLMGASQIGGIVIGLAMVAESRVKLMSKEGSEEAEDTKEVGGAISGAYTACGGLGILVCGKFGGSLFDRWSGAPFFLIAVLDGIAVVFALAVYFRQERRGSIRI